MLEAFLSKLGADTVNVKSLFTNTIENYKQKVALVAGAQFKDKTSEEVGKMLREAIDKTVDS